MKNSARNRRVRLLWSTDDARGLSGHATAFVVPWPPTQELSAEIRDEDRELAIEGRDLVLEIYREALVGPEEHFEHILVPEVHEVLVHGGCERLVGALDQKIESHVRVKHFESRVVRVTVWLPPAERCPRDPTPAGMFACASDLEVLSGLYRQVRAVNLCARTVMQANHQRDQREHGQANGAGGATGHLGRRIALPGARGKQRLRMSDWGLGIRDWGLGIGDWGLGIRD